VLCQGSLKPAPKVRYVHTSAYPGWCAEAILQNGMRKKGRDDRKVRTRVLNNCTDQHRLADPHITDQENTDNDGLGYVIHCLSSCVPEIAQCMPNTVFGACSRTGPEASWRR